jgi:hypothetical protein
LANINQPLRKIPDEVTHAANIYDANDWVNPLNGYNYDSFNPDVLQGMKVVNGNVVTQGGMNYKILVLPTHTKMNPLNRISERSIKKIIELVKAGATVLIDSIYQKQFVQSGATFNFRVEKNIIASSFGKGKFVLTPFVAESFKALHVDRDIKIVNSTQINHTDISFTHRKLDDADIYFISNQSNKQLKLHIALRQQGKMPEIFEANSRAIYESRNWEAVDGYTKVYKELNVNESVFIIFRYQAKKYTQGLRKVVSVNEIKLDMNWLVTFDTAYGGPSKKQTFKKLTAWNNFSNPSIKFYSGTAIYNNTFYIDRNNKVWLKIDSIYNNASIKVNGINCGTLWTPPYALDISKAVKKGLNTIEIAVTNTWNNRLVLDSQLPSEKRITYTMHPFNWSKKSLQPAGIIGEVKISSY